MSSTITHTAFALLKRLCAHCTDGSGLLDLDRHNRQRQQLTGHPVPFPRPPKTLSLRLAMSVNRSHQVLHRMVPLICQSLTSSDEETVWLEGLRLLCSPKLLSALAITSSIWLPLLIKGLDTGRTEKVNLAALRLLADVADQLKPMKSCLAKSLQALGRDSKIAGTDELRVVLARLDMQLPPDAKLVDRELRQRKPRPSRTVRHNSALTLFVHGTDPYSRQQQLPRPCSLSMHVTAESILS